MWTGAQTIGPILDELIPHIEEEKVMAVPLEFEYIPVEILSKQFTKLNSNHQYRIYYLGPRPLNTLVLHRRYGRQDGGQDMGGQQCPIGGMLGFKHYQVNLRKIINSNFTNQKLQENHYYKSAIFYRAFEGMNPTLPLHSEYIFNSAFEGGNLDCVIKINQQQFDLFLRVDANTRGHTAWYYFSVKNGKKKQVLTFNICNLKKPSCLYDQGMKPFVFSRKRWEERGHGWEQEGSNCRFDQTTLRYEVVHQRLKLGDTYRLIFDYQFQYEDDQVFFAYCVPYTYSHLQSDIQLYQQSPFVKKGHLGKTLSGLDIPIMHVTNHNGGEPNKKNIVITGRVHPAQSNSSHLLKGFIGFLLGGTREAEELRNRSNIFIVPMLNPDGVVLGNSRTGIAGKDLNRQFLQNKKCLYPEIHQLKNFVAKLQRKFGVFMYIDFHGHSRKKNTFLYGPNYPLSHPDYLKSRVLPKLIQKLNPKFRFYSCSFNISSEKRRTGRAVMLNQLKVPYSYTIQSSIGLYYNAQLMKTMAFTKEMWEDMGFSICAGLGAFTQAFMQFQSLLKERRQERERIKEKRLTTGKNNKKYAEDGDMSVKRGNSFMDMLQQVKVAACQVKHFEEEDESDDHDDCQDLQSYKLNEFNSMVTRGQERQLKINKKQSVDDNSIEQNFQEIKAPVIEEQVVLIQQKVPEIQRRTVKINVKSSEYLRKMSSTQIKSQTIIKSTQSIFKPRASLYSTQIKPMSNMINRSSKTIDHAVKQRYSLATKNLFPVQDKCQILSLPKNIQIMRKQMKKGRLLINNVEQTRIKFMSAHSKQEMPIYKKQVKTPFLQFDFAKLRQSNYSSIGYLGDNSRTLNLRQFSKQKHNHLNNNLQNYSFAQIQTDNLAMTITTFKKSTLH